MGAGASLFSSSGFASSNAASIASLGQAALEISSGIMAQRRAAANAKMLER